MEIFPQIGAAVAGIFVTVVFSGVLAGIVAYGCVEHGLRRRAQKAVIKAFVDKTYLEDRAEIGGEDESKSAAQEREARTKAANTGDLLPHLLGLPAENFFALPYRQLCGQIANRINAEMTAAKASADTPLTDILAAAAEKSEGGPAKTDDESTPHTTTPLSAREQAEKALVAIDILQIRLAEAVLRKAVGTAVIVVGAIFLALLPPTMVSLGRPVEVDNLVLKGVLWLVIGVIAVILMASFAAGAVIVASLAFRWIDRFASAR